MDAELLCKMGGVTVPTFSPPISLLFQPHKNTEAINSKDMFTDSASLCP